jgi:hypothetical protein
MLLFTQHSPLATSSANMSNVTLNPQNTCAKFPAQLFFDKSLCGTDADTHVEAMQTCTP